MKPSKFVSEARERIAQDEMFTPSFNQLSDIGQAHASLTAIVRYLDKVYEEQATMHKVLTDLTADDAPQFQVPDWIERARPVPCSDRMPKAEKRVLFFVPGHEDADRRWRVGAYTCPPLYCDTEWRDEESEVGDVGISWRFDEVTHWMPLPGEPT